MVFEPPACCTGAPSLGEAPPLSGGDQSVDVQESSPGRGGVHHLDGVAPCARERRNLHKLTAPQSHGDRVDSLDTSPVDVDPGFGVAGAHGDE